MNPERERLAAQARRRDSGRRILVNEHGCAPVGDDWCARHDRALVNPRGCDKGNPQGVPEDVQPRICPPCRLGCYCAKHDAMHGAEAEELRAGLEKLLARAGQYGRTTVDTDRLQQLLDDVDARDSLAYREQTDTPKMHQFQATAGSREALIHQLAAELQRLTAEGPA